MTEQPAWPVTVERRSNGDYMVFPEHMLNGFPATADELSAAGITPPAPDKRTALYALGLTDEDIAYAAEKWVDGAWLIDGTNKRLTVAIGDAAREVTS